MGEQRRPGPDDVVIDGIWVGEPTGGGCNEIAGGCALSVLCAASVPLVSWWALAASAGPADPEASAGAGVAWGMMYLWLVIAIWLLFGLAVSVAYLVGKSMTLTMLGFEAVFLVIMASVALLG